MDALPSVTLFLGGARSGKSRLAEEQVAGCGLKPVYMATAQAYDGEMVDRIADHIARRGPEWVTVEAPLDLVAALQKHSAGDTAILVDCLTIWITNLMMADKDIARECEHLLAACSALPGPVTFVSNEVGLGIVPDNQMARAFRDYTATLHQKIAEIAEEVYFVAAGLPLTLKG